MINASAQSVENPAGSYASFTNAFSNGLNFISAKVSAYVNFHLSTAEKFILFVLIFTVSYYLFFWLFYNQDSKKSSISNISMPPDNLTPAAMYFITHMGFCDEKTLSATFMSMVIKKFIKISNTHGEIYLEKIGTDTTQLSQEEKIINDNLFKQTEKFPLIKNNVYALYQTNKKISEYLTRTYPNSTHANFYLGIPGAILLIIAYIVGVIGTPTPTEHLFYINHASHPSPVPTSFRLALNIPILLFLSLAIGAFIFALSNLINFIKTLNTKYLLRTFLPLIIGLFTGVMSTIFLLTEVGLPFMTAVLLISLIIVNCLSLKLLSQPGPETIEIYNKILAFKSHLKTHENYEATETPQLTETSFKYLPYAIALDIENRWGDQLNGVLQNIGLRVVAKLNDIDMDYQRNH